MELFKSIKVINNFFYITYVQNEGAAFGIFKNARWFFIVLAVLAVLSIIRYIVIEKKVYKDEIISYSLLIGGIIGNLIDRIVYGYVIDYADFYIFGYNFPVFNIADACMVIGFILILYNLIVKGDRHEVNNSRRRSK
jgi:signal peptidase II